MMDKRIICFMVIGLMVAGCGSNQSAEEKEAVTQQKFSSALQKGIEELKSGNVYEALVNFNRAIKANPKDPQAYIILAETYMRLNRFENAVTILDNAVREIPDSGRLYYLLSINHRFIGNEEASLMFAQKSIALFRDQRDSENFKKSLALYQGLVNSRQETVSSSEETPQEDSL